MNTVVCPSCENETVPERRRRPSPDPDNPAQRVMSFVYACGGCSARIPDRLVEGAAVDEPPAAPPRPLAAVDAEAIAPIDPRHRRTSAARQEPRPATAADLYEEIRRRADDSRALVERLEKELATAREDAERLALMVEILPPAPPLAAE